MGKGVMSLIGAALILGAVSGTAYADPMNYLGISPADLAGSSSGGPIPNLGLVTSSSLIGGTIPTLGLFGESVLGPGADLHLERLIAQFITPNLSFFDYGAALNHLGVLVLK